MSKIPYIRVGTGGNNNRQSQEIENVQKTIKPRR